VIRGLVLVALALALLAGCAGDDDGDTGTDETTARVYLLRGGEVWPVGREISSTDRANGALAVLLEGPTGEEEDELEATSAIPDDVESITVEVVADAPPQLEVDGELSEEALAQVVYTVSQFPGSRVVAYDGRTIGRSDFEDFTPSVLVESPLAFEEVSSPIRATGTANTFEATFEYEVIDPDGDVVADNFVTATSGSGTRGTFDFTTAEFESSDGDGSLVVFEISAEDGSRTNEVEIPLRLVQG
jgi:germination protein M